MKNAILLFLFFTYTIHSQQSRLWLVDTNEKYESYINRLEEGQDCSVRTIAEAFDLSYYEAHRYVAEWGRLKGRGIKLSLFMRGLRKDFYSAIKQNSQVASIRAQQFIDTYAEDGYVYLVSSMKHMFVIEQNARGRWIVKGNYDDKKTPIVIYIKLNIKEWKK